MGKKNPKGDRRQKFEIILLAATTVMIILQCLQIVLELLK